MIPSYPLRPSNGGPLHLARPKRGQWTYEPKINGWRALVHAPTSRMWNRRGQRLSIEHEFAAVLEAIRTADLPPEMEWLDCEALERRHDLGRGSLVILDYLAPGKTTYEERQLLLADAIHPRGETREGFERWQFDRVPPPADRALIFQSPFTGSDLEHYWQSLQDLNWLWKAEVFEGFVAKRIDSPYPRQLRSPNLESPHWVKHRWDF
jgi:hypothetical protein